LFSSIFISPLQTGVVETVIQLCFCSRSRDCGDEMGGIRAAASVSVRVKARVRRFAIRTPKLLDTCPVHKSRLDQQAIFLKADITHRIASDGSLSVFPLSIAITVLLH
jgi:hypothetical protein